MQKFLKKVTDTVVSGNSWKKLARPTVSRGKTAFPKEAAEQQRLGVRYDYDGEIEGEDGTVYNRFQIQANQGDNVPSTIKNWREANGGTHAVMANVLVKKDGTKEDVEEALTAAHKGITGN